MEGYTKGACIADGMCLPKIHSKGCNMHTHYRAICDHSQSNNKGVNLHLVNGQGHFFLVNVQRNIMFPLSILKCYLCKYSVLHKMICSLQFLIIYRDFKIYTCDCTVGVSNHF